MAEKELKELKKPISPTQLRTDIYTCSRSNLCTVFHHGKVGGMSRR